MLKIFIRIVGAAVIIFAIATNPLIIERFFSPDQKFDQWWKYAVNLLFNLVVFLPGLYFFFKPDGAIEAKKYLNPKWLFKNRKREIFLLISVSLACLFLFETLIRLDFVPLPGWNSDGWWKERWLKNKNYHLLIDKYDSVLGHTLLENLDNVPNLLGYPDSNNLVSSNSKGIRSKEEYSFEKSEKKRILTIGASYTFGECVNDDQNFPTYLDSFDKNSEVINMGVHAYGSD